MTRRPRRPSNPRLTEPEGIEAAPAKPRRPKTPDEARDELLAYAFRALGARALSASELRAKLERRSEGEHDPELVAAVLARVQELGYQQDEQVARIETARRGVGQFRVRQTLKRRGLDTDLIDETLAAIDPDDERAAALDLLSRRWAALSRKRDPRAAAYGLLARRGFPGSVIWDVIAEVSAGALSAEDDGSESAAAEQEDDPED